MSGLGKLSDGWSLEKNIEDLVLVLCLSEPIASVGTVQDLGNCCESLQVQGMLRLWDKE